MCIRDRVPEATTQRGLLRLPSSCPRSPGLDWVSHEEGMPIKDPNVFVMQAVVWEEGAGPSRRPLVAEPEWGRLHPEASGPWARARQVRV